MDCFPSLMKQFQAKYGFYPEYPLGDAVTWSTPTTKDSFFSVPPLHQSQAERFRRIAFEDRAHFHRIYLPQISLEDSSQTACRIKFQKESIMRLSFVGGLLCCVLFAVWRTKRTKTAPSGAAFAYFGLFFYSSFLYCYLIKTLGAISRSAAYSS